MNAADTLLTPEEELRFDAMAEVAADYRRGAELYADRFRALRHGPQSSVVIEALSLITIVYAYEVQRCAALGVRTPKLEDVCEEYGLLPRANFVLVTKAVREAGN